MENDSGYGNLYAEKMVFLAIVWVMKKWKWHEDGNGDEMMR